MFRRCRKANAFWCVSAALTVLLTLFLFTSAPGCNSDDDDDDESSGPTPENGWSGGCNWTYYGDETSALTTASAEEDCLPPDPGNNSNYDFLGVMMDAYTGAYENQSGRAMEITCRPEGSWRIPPTKQDDSRCAYYFNISLWVSFPDTEEVLPASVEQLTDSFDSNTALYYWYEDSETIISGGREGDIDGVWYWELSDGSRWTKVD